MEQNRLDQQVHETLGGKDITGLQQREQAIMRRLDELDKQSAPTPGGRGGTTATGAGAGIGNSGPVPSGPTAPDGTPLPAKPKLHNDSPDHGGKKKSGTTAGGGGGGGDDPAGPDGPPPPPPPDTPVPPKPDVPAGGGGEGTGGGDDTAKKAAVAVAVAIAAAIFGGFSAAPELYPTVRRSRRASRSPPPSRHPPQIRHWRRQPSPG